MVVVFQDGKVEEVDLNQLRIIPTSGTFSIVDVGGKEFSSIAFTRKEVETLINRRSDYSTFSLPANLYLECRCEGI